eukprot:TRINITY_DN2426_c0_g1_i2.p1 TRINITY_DN2426_c0_g1~~TRINITY_DN2426_c0_g1_i2.p1  ORF type:complete len:205 (+),score=33.50 TRINITY_DN2426_c0_g1_i2:65-679(+)
MCIRDRSQYAGGITDPNSLYSEPPAPKENNSSSRYYANQYADPVSTTQSNYSARPVKNTGNNYYGGYDDYGNTGGSSNNTSPYGVYTPTPSPAMRVTEFQPTTRPALKEYAYNNISYNATPVNTGYQTPYYGDQASNSGAMRPASSYLKDNANTGYGQRVQPYYQGGDGGYDGRRKRIFNQISLHMLVVSICISTTDEILYLRI